MPGRGIRSIRDENYRGRWFALKFLRSSVLVGPTGTCSSRGFLSREFSGMQFDEVVHAERLLACELEQILGHMVVAALDRGERSSLEVKWLSRPVAACDVTEPINGAAAPA
jgi:hypothetical protein